MVTLPILTKIKYYSHYLVKNCSTKHVSKLSRFEYHHSL